MTEPIWVFAEYDWDAVHKLLHECFAYMETRIDPTSSLHRLTPQMIADFAADECLFVIEDNQRPIACIFMTEKPDCLYLGKLAVSHKYRGNGHARTLIKRAEQMARDLDLTTLQLETRIELTENHLAFERMGFHKVAETAHTGYDRPTSITMQMELPTKGHCLCGATSWEYSGDETWACFCHCDDCRRNCAAPVTAFIGVQLANFKWTGKTPKIYRSSKAVQRHFCETCGTPMAFQAEHYAGEIHLYAASMDNPQDFKPEFHVHYDDKLDWLHIRDDLPKYPHSKT